MTETPPVQTSEPAAATEAAQQHRPTSQLEAYMFKPHPLLPLPALEEIGRDLADPAKRAACLKFLNDRATRLMQAERDPLYGRLRLPQSRKVDELLLKYQLVYESGGKRAGKTEDGVPRFLESCLKYGKAKRWAMQDNALSSIANLQQTFWNYMPPSIKALNFKHTRNAKATYRIHYKPDTGFDGLLILPNGCEVYFLNYTQNPQDFLGWKLGKALDVPLDGKTPDIGALLDENCPLAWLENIQLRCSDLGSKIHWMYSPQDGITPTIKELVTGAETIETRPAELLSDRVNVPGLPKGEMPHVQVDEARQVAVFYRFTEWNPFSGYDRPGGVKQLCAGRPKDYVMAHAYGYCEAVRGRALPLFGEWNVVKPEDVPAKGTNWMVTDPGGARNWFTLWARVTPGRPGEVYIYREWPDWETHGDWTVTSRSPKRLNGERGPAQPTIGYGPAEYKKLFWRLERIICPSALKKPEVRSQESELEKELAKIPDPHHRLVIRQAIEREEDLENLSETIFERLIDPRAARNQSAADGKGVDLLRKLQQRNLNEATGAVEAEPMYFTPAPGLDIRDGISQINELLFFNQNEERIPLLNAPRLFVSARCRNLIYSMKTYCKPNDAESDSDDACEDPIDDLRYLVTRGVRYIEPGGKVKTTGGGSY